jgi:unsaturated rhamnogalacturonyl hydrolase
VELLYLFLLASTATMFRYSHTERLIMKIARFCTLLVLFFTTICSMAAQPQTRPLSQQMADDIISRWKDSSPVEFGKSDVWNYEQAVMLEGISRVWYKTADPKYFDYVRKGIDRFVNEDGSIRSYRPEDYNSDSIRMGTQLLMLYGVTGQEKYFKAATLLRDQLKKHPRTNEGGFWHKKRYPFQMWLDGLYMVEPFYAQYSAMFHEPSNFDDIANQFIWMEAHARDPKTGLLYHGWDESKKQAWANKKTGVSPNFWGRAIGWYAMALVDVIPYMPENNPKRAELIAILNHTAEGIKRAQDPKTGLWWEVMDKPNAKGNYLEASASCMFVYSLARGVRRGYLPASYLAVAQKGYAGIPKEFITTDPDKSIHLEKTVGGAGLGRASESSPNRDASYEYYINEKIVRDDAKGLGALLMAATEMETVPTAALGRGKVAVLDSYFNNETRKDITGTPVLFHYKWNELSNAGFWFFGETFRNYGVQTRELTTAPTAENLRNVGIYIIANPDNPAKIAQPNYVDDTHVKAITEWVKNGGVLLLMENNAGNSDFEHFNKLGDAFGIHFNEVTRNYVEGKKFEQGKIMIPAGNPVLKSVNQIYMKEICTLTLKSPAKPVLEDKGDVLMAVSHLGKGTVLAVVDPWLYNEYVDGRKLPSDYQNFAAAQDLVQWLVQQLPKKK